MTVLGNILDMLCRFSQHACGCRTTLRRARTRPRDGTNDLSQSILGKPTCVWSRMEVLHQYVDLIIRYNHGRSHLTGHLTVNCSMAPETQAVQIGVSERG